MNKLFLTVLLPLLLLTCGKETNTIVIPTPSEKAPTSISLSPTSLSAPVGGDSYTVTVTSPSKPELSAPPDWITCTEGTYKNYKMPITLKVTEVVPDEK